MKTPEEIADELLSRYDAGYDHKTNLHELIAQAIRQARDEATEECAKVIESVRHVVNPMLSESERRLIMNSILNICNWLAKDVRKLKHAENGD